MSESFNLLTEVQRQRLSELISVCDGWDGKDAKALSKRSLQTFEKTLVGIGDVPLGKAGFTLSPDGCLEMHLCDSLETVLLFNEATVNIYNRHHDVSGIRPSNVGQHLIALGKTHDI